MDDAVTAALARIKRAAAAHKRAKTRETKAREDLHTAIVAAFNVGAKPSDVEGVSPYDRNHNARIRGNAPGGAR